MGIETLNILTEQIKKSLREDIIINGGEVIDPNFEELEKYLKLNPPETAKS